MESSEESIRMLEMRMKRQLSLSHEKNINPENIQYYISSAMLQKKEIQQDAHNKENTIYQTVNEQQANNTNLPNGKKATETEEEILQQNKLESYRKALSIEKNSEQYRQLKKPEISETIDVLHIKAKNEYEKTLRSIHTGTPFEIKESGFFNGKV